MTISPSRLRRSSWFALIALVATLLLAACAGGTTSGKGATAQPAKPLAAGKASASASASSKPAYSGPVKTVKVSSLEGDGGTYGIGMPIILSFDPAPTDSTAFTKAATVTVDGQPANGAWFWEKPYSDQPIQAHYRPQHYWPAHSTVEVQLPIGGLSAGRGLVYSGKLTSLTFNIGEAHISTIDANSRRMTVQSDGKVVHEFEVSLGKASTPTYNGVKVVMQKGEGNPTGSGLRPNGAVRMVGPGYNEIVNWSVRITTSGEYVHAAPWNSAIGRASTSNGCTNLTTADAKTFYQFSQIGDVLEYANTDGHKMPSWDGYGDWNVPWPTWKQGGLLLNH